MLPIAPIPTQTEYPLPIGMLPEFIPLFSNHMLQARNPKVINVHIMFVKPSEIFIVIAQQVSNTPPKMIINHGFIQTPSANVSPITPTTMIKMKNTRLRSIFSLYRTNPAMVVNTAPIPVHIA